MPTVFVARERQSTPLTCLIRSVVVSAVLALFNRNLRNWGARSLYAIFRPALRNKRGRKRTLRFSRLVRLPSRRGTHSQIRTGGVFPDASPRRHQGCSRRNPPQKLSSSRTARRATS